MVPLSTISFQKPIKIAKRNMHLKGLTLFPRTRDGTQNPQTFNIIPVTREKGDGT